jgi:twitching motility protein PilT
MEIALTAGETGHVVYSTLHTISAGQTINRILGMFSREEEEQVRERLAGSLRYIVSQRLVPRKQGGRMLVTELMGSSLRTREAILLGENDNRRFFDIIEAGSTMGWHSFEQSLLKAYEEDSITDETAMLFSVNKSTMRQRIDAANKRAKTTPESHSLKMAALPTPPARAIRSPSPVPNPSQLPASDSPAPVAAPTLASHPVATAEA